MMFVSTWINKEGKIKIKSTFGYPKVRLIDNPRDRYNSSDYMKIIHKDAIIGDIDYYGWIMIDIHEQTNLFTIDRKHKPTTEFLDKTNKIRYRKMLYNINKRKKRWHDAIRKSKHRDKR